MIGELSYINNQWNIKYFSDKSISEVRVLVNPQSPADSYEEGDKVVFEIIDGFAKILKFLKDSYTPYLSDNFQIGPEGAYELDYETWEEIYREIEQNLHVSLPMRLKYWFKNKFEVPKVKSDKTIF